MSLLHPFLQVTITLRQALFAWLLAGLALAATTSVAWAEPLAHAGLVTDVVGTAWVLDPNTRTWAPLQRDQMVAQGDQLRTAPLSRVTLRVGSSTLWLDAQTELFVLQMNDAAFTLRLLAGDMALRLRDAQAARATRVQTREGVVSQPMEGLIRIAQGNRVTRVGVLQGRAQFDSDPGAPLQRAWLREGEQAGFVWDESARMEREPPSHDSFSAWFINGDLVESGLAPQHADAYFVPREMAPPENPPRYESRGTTVIEMGRIWIPTPTVRGWEPRRREVVPRPHQYPQPQPQTQPPPDVHKPRPHHEQPAPVVTPVPRATPPPAQTAPVAPAAPRPAAPTADETRNKPRHHPKLDNPDRESRKPNF
jgi:hypothetical protein